MIKGVHAMFYAKEPEAVRAFLRDKLELPATDVGDGWLIFDMPEGDMGVHPADESRSHGAPNGTHDISFYCDDVASTRAELERRGVAFDGGITDQGYGLVTYFFMPGEIRIQLYQPHYQRG